MQNSFFSMLFRMKYIDRWALMRNSRQETLTEHAMETAVVAHAIALIGNVRCGKNYNADRAAVLGLFHDAHEILTGDMPTPVKYQNSEICSAFKGVEAAANKDLLKMLPEDLREYYREPIEESDDSLRPIIKAADKIVALIKCMEERKAGNAEFLQAEEAVRSAINLKMEEVKIFMDEFLPAFECTLDEMRK